MAESSARLVPRLGPAEVFAGLEELVRPSPTRPGSWEAEAAVVPELEARLRFGLVEPGGEVMDTVEIVGPLTLAWALKVEGFPVLHRPGLLAALAARVTRLALWHAGRLAADRVPVLVTIHEPALVWEIDPATGCLPEPVRGLSVVTGSLEAAGFCVEVT